MPSLRRPETYRARRLRKEMSLPEVLLWERLRGGLTGLKFRRQHPIGPYVVDFYCSAARLIVEVDGKAHDDSERAERDLTRQGYFEENGYTVIRLMASDVLKDAARAADAVARSARPLHRPADGPPPHAGEDN